MIVINMSDPQFWMGFACAIALLFIVGAIFSALEKL